MGHIYIENFFTVYLKFKFNRAQVVLFVKSDNSQLENLKFSSVLNIFNFIMQRS